MLGKTVNFSKFIFVFVLIIFILASINSVSAQNQNSIKAPVSFIVVVDDAGSSSLYVVAQQKLPVLGSVAVIKSNGTSSNSIIVSEYLIMASPSGPAQIGAEENNCLSPGDWIQFWGDCVCYGWMIPQDFVLIPGNVVYLTPQYELYGDWE